MTTPLIEAPSPDEVRRYQMYVGGEWVKPHSGKSFESTNPYTGVPWAEVPEADDTDVDQAVGAARNAFDSGPWGRMTADQRAHHLRRLAELIGDNAESLARLETTDNGKLLREMRGQMDDLSRWYHYFAGAADKIQGDTIPCEKPNYFVYTLREPIGVVAAILPWNSPLELLTWKLAPALAAGCTVVAKPAEQTSASTLEFAKLVETAGFPPGVFNVITGPGATVGRNLVRHPHVDKVAFTGSTETGRSVMRDAAEHLARVSLELGGKSPNIVMPDADLDAAASGAVAGIFAAAGQTCVAGSRLLVARTIHNSFVERLIAKARAIKLGDPLEPGTEMGPLAFGEQLERAVRYIAIGGREGARLVTGGRRPDAPGLRNGYFVEPTIFVDVTNQMRVAREEIFGPVLSVLTFDDEDEAVAIANDTRYGLAAGVWTRDVQLAHRMARSIRAGTVWVNGYRVVAPSVPFGGYRHSGLGREMGLESLNEYTQTKSVWIELTGQARDPFKLG